MATLSLAANPPLARTRVNPWIIAGTVMLATFMEVMDTSVANVALPHIAGNLSAGVDESTWVLTSYLVSNAIILPLSGWFSSILGRKNFYMICVGVFTISSLLCGLAPSLGLLVFFRVLQGIGGGALQPVSQAILAESFPPKKLGMAIAIFAMGVVLAPVIGPTLGGWITDNYSWRWIFFINLPVGVLSLLLTRALIFDPDFMLRKKLSETKMDYVGLGLLATGLGALEILFDEGQRHDWFSSAGIACVALIAVFCLVAVVLWELNHPDPVVDFRLWGDRNFAISCLTMFVLGAMLYGSTVLLPIFLQTLMGYSALNSGLVLSPGGVVIVMLLPLVGFLTRHTSARWLLMIGIVVSSAGLVWMARFTLGIDFSTAVWARVLQSAGLPFLFVPINTVAFAGLEKTQTNAGSGLINLARNVGGSAGIAMVTTVMARQTQKHQALLVHNINPANASVWQGVDGLAATLAQHGQNAAAAGQQALAMLYGAVQQQAAMLGIEDCFLLLAVLFLALIPFALILRDPIHQPKQEEGGIALH